MRFLRPLRLALLACLAFASSAAAENVQMEFLFHEEPLHIAPDSQAVVEGTVADIVTLNVATNNASHDLRFEGYDFTTPLVPPGQGSRTTQFAFDKPGLFEYYCTVPGHRDGGMRGFLTVVALDTGKNGTPGIGAVAALAVLAAAALLAGARRR